MSEIPWGQYAEAYKAIYQKIADVLSKLDNPVDPTVVDIQNRASRLLGIVYGSQNQQLLQRAGSYDLLIQLRHNDVEYDARIIRALTAADVVSAVKSGTWNIDNLLNPHPISNLNLDVALSTRLKKEDLNLDAEKDLQVDVKTMPTVTTVGETKTFKTAKIDHATAGDNAIVAAVAGKRVKVYGIVLVVSAAVNCKWRSAVTDLTGDMNFGGKGEGYAQAVQPPAFLLATAAGEALNLNLSAAVAVDGHVSYWDNDSE